MRVGQRNYTVLADERLATHDIEEMTLAFADH